MMLVSLILLVGCPQGMVYIQVQSVAPEDGATGVEVNAVARITFSVDMHEDTLNESSVLLAQGGDFR